MFRKSDKGSSKSNVKNAITYVAGSMALCAAAMVIIPKASSYISGIINKKMAKINNAKELEDDWGPVIEKKNPVENGEEEQ